MLSYQYRKPHCGDKTVVRSSYLHNGISYTGKMTSLYWIRALYPSCTFLKGPWSQAPARCYDNSRWIVAIYSYEYRFPCKIWRVLWVSDLCFLSLPLVEIGVCRATETIVFCTGHAKNGFHQIPPFWNMICRINPTSPCLWFTINQYSYNRPSSSWLVTVISPWLKLYGTKILIYMLPYSEIEHMSSLRHFTC